MVVNVRNRKASTALESKIEQAVMDSIEALQGKRTTVAIAHRMNTIFKCDMIYNDESEKSTLSQGDSIIIV